MLDTDETLVIPDGDVATLVLVIAGTVGASVGGDDLTELVEDAAATLDGELTITNAGTDPATVIAAVIGPAIPALAEQPK